MIDHAYVRQSLTGPIPSIRMPFLKDGGIDLNGLHAQIDFGLAAGSKTILLTAGDSHYFALSDEDIAQVTRVVVEHVAGRAMVVAADRHYNTAQAIAFAKYCRGIGVDVLMVMPPDWGGSCTAETLAMHYASVAEHISVMLVTNVFVPRGEAFGLQVLEQTLKATNNVVAIKDDMCGTFARKMSLLVHEHWAVLSGGQKQNHLNNYPYGCDGYLSTFMSFMPDVSRQYWSAIEQGDVSGAASVIRDFDMPFFDLVLGMPGGFDAGIHGVLELADICKRWRRSPYYSLSDEEMAHLADGLKKIGIDVTG